MIRRPIDGTVSHLGGSCGWRRCCWTVEQEHETGSLSVLAPSRVPEAVVADLVQTFGQNVLQESAHEFVAVQAGVLPFPRLALFVADGNTAANLQCTCA